VVLRVLRPKEHAGAITLDNSVEIGKTPECDLVIEGDCYMSRRHVRIYRSDGQVLAEDLGSANGTFLRLVKPAVLQPGDELLIGTSVVQLEETSQ